MMKVAVLANGGQSLGMGHIMRCLALANELKLFHCDINFISTMMEGIKSIHSYGYTVINPVGHTPAVNSGILSMENHICDFLKSHIFDLLIVDSYDVTYDFLINLKRRVGKLAYIDDLHAFTYPVDILINGNVNAEKLGYQKYTPAEVFLIGSRFNLIRQEFRCMPLKEHKDEVKSILITSGGSDPYSMCHKIAEMILADMSLTGLQLKIVIRRSFIFYDHICDLAMRHSAITLYQEPECISKLMLESDIAVSSAGSTLYELCACGVPTLSFIMAENQVGLAGEMDKQGLIKCLGWYDRLSIENLCTNIKDLMIDRNRRTTISSGMQKLVDGFGTKRTAEKIMKIMQSKERN